MMGLIAISLQPEQKVAVNAILTGEDVFIVSLMGSKNFLFIRHFISGFSVRIICSVLVVSPLKSIVEDQIKECQSWAFRRLRFENLNTNE